MKKLILLVLTASFVSNVRGQLSIIPVAGLNVSNYRNTSDNFPFKQNKLLVGYCAGALVDIPLTEQLSLQPGLLYKLNGYKWSTDNVKQTVSINTVEIPVKLVYSFNVGSGNRLFIGAGPYAAINVSGKSHIKGNLTFDSTMSPTTPRAVDFTTKVDIGGPNEIQRLDVGAGISVGLKGRNGLFVSVQGQYGLKDLAPSGSRVQIHNYNFGIVGGYSFKLKKHKARSEDPAGAKQ
jgi:hypothetical protein